MPSSSPVRRRATPSGSCVDSTPMLMSARSELDTTDLIATDGRIVLTPTREMSQQFLDEDSGVYEQVGTPPHDPTRTAPLFTNSERRVLSSGLPQPLVAGEAPMRKLRATQSFRSGAATSAAPPPPKLSRTALKLWHVVANAVLVLALVASVVSRVTAISAVYLVVLCFGMACSLASTPLVLFTITVSGLACVGHIVCGVLLKNVRDGYEGQAILRILGFSRLTEITAILRYAGVDMLVFVCSVFHFLVVLRRLRLPMQAETFDYFDAAAALLGQDDEANRRQTRRKSSMIHKIELLCATLLFLTAFSVPAAVSAIYYVLLVWRLVLWTVCAKRVGVDEFVHQHVRIDFFVGPLVAKALVALSFLTIFSWYVLLFPDLASSSVGRDIIKYAGYADFGGSSIKWQYYVFITVASLLFACTTKLAKMHTALANIDATTDPRLEAASFYDVEGSAQRSPAYQPAFTGAPAVAATPNKIVVQLQQLPFLSRMFLRDGGSLLASAATIVWCVSYPSYGSAPMMGWALATLAVYGLMPGTPLVVALICYATVLSMTEYAVNLTWDFVSADYTKYGLKQFKYPFLDLAAHNACLFIIYASMRTRWRYENVLKASRQETNDAAARAAAEEEAERNSMEAFRAMMGARTTTTTKWSDLLPLWFQDAKQVVLTHLGALVLLTIVAVALSTKESLFQAGYLILAMLCIIFFKHRQKLWRALLVYALAVCLASFIRNVDCTQDDQLDLIGLECYSETSDTWRSLWPTLFSAQLVIIFQLVFQLVIYVTSANTIKQRMETIDTSHQNPIFFVSRIAVEVDNCFRVIGGPVCYIAILIVLFHSELLDTCAHTTVLGAVQLIVLLVVIGGNLGKFKRTPRTSLRLKLLWSLVLVVEVLILVARYIFHFKDVSNYLESHVFTTSFMSARAFGLEKRSSKAALSGVFLYLAPTAVIIGLTFWQLASLMKEVRTYEVFVAGRSQIIDRILFWIDTIRRVLIAFSTTALVLVTMCVALSKINAIGAAYVVVLVVGRPLSSWQKLWFPLFWVSAIAIGATYAYQLRLFGGAEISADDGYYRVRMDEDAAWFGLDRLVVVDTNGSRTSSTSMWKLTGGPLLVILMCFLQRMAQFLERSLKKTATEFTPMLQIANQLSQEAAVSSHELSPRASDSRRTPASKRRGSFKQQSFLSPNAPQANAVEEEDEDGDFFSHLRDFCIEYASSASVNVVMLLLTASAFLHRDIISIAYLVIVYVIMYASPVKVCRLWFLLAFGLSAVILLEYALIVWIPPLAGVEKQDLQPWKSLTPAQQQWFGLSNQHKWSLLADFIALLAVYMLPNSNRLRPVEQKVVSIQIQRASRRPSMEFGTLIHQDSAAGVDNASFKSRYKLDLQESEFIRNARKSVWHAVVYFVLLAWLPVTLVVTFICGAKHGGIASFVYIGGAVYMLYRLDDARLPTCRWIHQLRKFNWVHLFVMVVIGAPYIQDSLSKCIVGANDNSGDVCLSVQELLGVQTASVPTGIIAIFVLISIQCEMLTTETYEAVCQHFQLEKLQAPARQEAIVKQFYRERTAQWFTLKKEKSAALQRLKMIVSKLVHKVEELMDIAMGLHYNLPPMAPPKPRLVERFQNAVTLEWDPPQESLHKIRFYRITRQQFPSQTLLGDFSDVVEVKGDTLSAKIEGLRPGNSYQFKVAAVSRMGEGPFSVASDPIATYPLNLDGSCTAGWMKYRRENVAQSWYSVWLAKLQPKYLHRYVVVDQKRLVFYKDEELALRHRSKKRRKKIKTSFVWKDVLTLRLSDEKIQFDDVSPKLFCFELIVRQEGNHADLKYVFHVDIVSEFDRFLSALAFAVPRYAVDESILQCLREKRLPVPDEIPTGDDNDAPDETGSEMSSVTGGEESSFGDAEDAEFDEQPRGSWRIPVYRWFYGLQDAAMQAETTEYDAEDLCEPSIGEIVSVVINAIRSRTVGWCYVAMVMSFARQADLLNFVYIVVTFGYLAIESPRPSSQTWVMLLKYTCGIILLRYVFQLPIFCQGLSGGGYFYPSIQPFCGAPSNSVVLQEQSIQPAVVFGIYKFDGTTLPGQDDIFGGLQWDFFVALAILWHRRELIIRGLWVDAVTREQDGDDFQLTTSRRLLNGSVVSSCDSIDESFNFGGDGGRAAARAIGYSEPIAPVSPEDKEAEDQQVEQLVKESDLTEQILQELEAEVEKERTAKEAQDPQDDTDAAQERRESERHDETINVVTEQIEMDVADDTAIFDNIHKNKKKSWLEVKYPQVYEFFQGVICDPPPHWDKDIHAAIAGSKPGRDYYAASLSIMLFACIFAVIFFQAIGAPDATKTSASGAAQVQSNSMVSGYLVLIVFIQLCFIIWDRAAYVCGSLKTKIVLQYSYIFLLHLCLWLLMPPHIGEYFQDRAMLVIFYLLHCVSLWLGALQIRYGYPVFRGSKYNTTDESSYHKAQETIFTLVMLAPFLFEMRALLDYVCTKTSLSWQHWVLLEDTAAHLYQVKQEMRGRVKHAEVLQGKQRQPLHKKLMSAGVMLLFLLLCLIGPLLLFSSANPSTTPNRVTTTEIVFGIEDSRGTVNKLYTGIDINSPDYESEQIAEGAAVQRVTYDTFSRDVWSSSPPNIERLVTQLNSTEALSWILTISFARPGPTDHQNIETTERVALTAADRVALVPLIRANDSKSVTKPIEVFGILPPIVELTATSGVFQLSSRLRNVTVTKQISESASWWSVTPMLQSSPSSTAANDREFCGAASPFCLIAVSDNIVQGLSSLGIGSYGITAVYIFVLVTVGSAVKGFFRGALFQIQYAELPDPEDVLELVEGIYIARSERYIGHLKDEIRIFETLVRVLRSPETLTKVTGTNVIHIPTAKEKIE